MSFPSAISLVRATACGALVCALLFGAGASAEPVRQKTPINRKVLDNGLTVLVKPEKGSGLVAIVACIRTGAAQESIQNAGIGNFVAQLLLAGTRLSSAEEVATISDQVGGNIGTQWHPDFTEIRAVTTSAMFSKAMDLVGESLTEANFESKWVEQVRTDLLKQFRQGNPDPYQQAYDDLRSLLYQDNGYRRGALGFERTLKLASPQDLRKFYSLYYVPNNIVISVVGDVTVEQALDRAEKAFAGVPPGELPINRGMPDESLDRSTYRAREADVPVAYLMLGWLAPQAESADFAAMNVLANVLGGGKGSMMFRELRQKRGMGYDLGATYPRFKYQSHLVAYVYTDPYKLVLPNVRGSLVLEEVKSAILQLIDDLKNKPLSDQDLQRGKGYTIGTYALSQQHLVNRAFELAWLEAIGAGGDLYSRFADDVQKVTADDIQRVARKYLTNYAAMLLMPKPQSPQIQPVEPN